MAIAVPTCAVCGLMVFPPHLRCARCGSTDWTSTAVTHGTLEAVTVVERSLVAAEGKHPVVGVVRLPAGQRVIVRVDGGAGPSEEVALSDDGGAVVAAPA